MKLKAVDCVVYSLKDGEVWQVYTIARSDKRARAIVRDGMQKSFSEKAEELLTSRHSLWEKLANV